jgi:predicted RNase H-like nuclease
VIAPFAPTAARLDDVVGIGLTAAYPADLGLVPKIRDWDQAAPAHNLIEAHPELSFRAMAPGLDFAVKKSARGAAQRIAALGRWLSVLAPVDH